VKYVRFLTTLPACSSSPIGASRLGDRFAWWKRFSLGAALWMGSEECAASEDGRGSALTLDDQDAARSQGRLQSTLVDVRTNSPCAVPESQADREQPDATAAPTASKRKGKCASPSIDFVKRKWSGSGSQRCDVRRGRGWQQHLSPRQSQSGCHPYARPRKRRSSGGRKERA
jgi:hypothetical protein